MKTIKVTVLGNCANQTAENEGVAFLVDTDVKILIDSGPGIVRQILRAERKFSEIENIIITHQHGDHIAGFPYLIWNYFYESLSGISCPETINIYCFEHLQKGLLNMFEFCYGSLDKFPFNLNFYNVPDKGTGSFKIGQTNIETIPVDHTVPTFGLSLTYSGKKFVYSSDTTYCEDLINFSKNSDLLIHEAMVLENMFDLSRKTKHSTAKDAGKIADLSSSKQLGLVHYFPPLTNKKDDFINESKSVFNGKVFIPDELSIIEI